MEEFKWLLRSVSLNLLLPKASRGKLKVKSCSQIQIQTKKQCLRCNTLYSDEENSPTACAFHGHANDMPLPLSHPLNFYLLCSSRSRRYSAAIDL
ncbi:hypothetical protein K1719_041322 [Acacia pycnantha]|nr:hypothetical protein K1719_041322 [Acacia pycnantha]